MPRDTLFPSDVWRCSCRAYNAAVLDRCRDCGAMKNNPAIKQSTAKADIRKAHSPNKTELACIELFPGFDWQYEAQAFEVCGGAKYTPDWVDKGRKVAIEAKGEFIHSRDSRRRFDEAVHLYPDWRWIWARLRTKGRKGRRWEIEIYNTKGSQQQ